jgi:hypothetical protein
LKVKEAKECGVYLRWIDRHGWMRYWLFHEGEMNEVTKGAVALEGVHVAQLYEYEKQVYARKDVVKSVRLCAPLVDNEQWDILSTICTSVVVEMYYGGEWFPVVIDGQSVVKKGEKERRPLNDFECVMVWPKILNQML